MEEELEVSGDQRSFCHVKAVFAQESLTNPDSLPLVVALMAEEDTRSSVSGFTRVDWTTGEPREDPTGGVMRRDAVVEEVVEASAGEPMATASGTLDTKGAVSGGPATGEATSGEKPPGGPSSGPWKETSGEETAQEACSQAHAEAQDHQGENRAWDNCQGTREEPFQEPGDEETPEGEVGRD